MKVKESRFQVHDELTAPERSLPILKGALSGGGQLSNLLGVLAGSPATLRAYALARSELRHGTLPLPTQQRIALAAAARGRSDYALAMLQRTARDVGLGVDEIALAKRYDSRDEREAALLRYLRALDDRAEVPPAHLHEEAKEAGWSDEQLLEAVAHLAFAGLTTLITRSADMPNDGSVEERRLSQAA